VAPLGIDRTDGLAARNEAILERRRQRAGVVEIAVEFGLSKGMVSRICREGLDEQEQRDIKRDVQARSHPPHVPRIERFCEWCGAPFNISATEARHRPGRFCSPQCACASNWSGPDAERRREAGWAALRERRDGIAREKAQMGLLYLYEVVGRLPREFRRSTVAALRHMRAGGLVPTYALGLRLFTEESAADFLSWLETHPDPRVQLHNVVTPARARYRAEWYRALHKSPREFGRLAQELAAGDGKTVGRPGLPAEKQAQIRDLRSNGLSVRAIARIAGVGRGQVERLLAQT
jgi:hypothetical protein